MKVKLSKIILSKQLGGFENNLAKMVFAVGDPLTRMFSYNALIFKVNP